MIFLVWLDPVFENKKVSPAKQPEKKKNYRWQASDYLAA